MASELERLKDAYTYAARSNTPEAWEVAADAAEEVSELNAALVFRFFATIAPRPVESPHQIITALHRLGAYASRDLDNARLDVSPDVLRPRGMKRLPLFPLFQALATRFVGTATELYFVSNRSGVFAIYRYRDEAIDLARYRNLYVEGPSGEEWHATWA